MRFWQELTTTSGVLAVVLLAATVILPARLKTLTRAMGIEALLGSHRFLGLCSTLAIALHVASVLIGDPRSLRLMNVYTAPGRAVAGVFATVCVFTLVYLTKRRPRGYETWRWSHVVLSFAIIGGTTVHVVLIGRIVKSPIGGAFFTALALIVLAIGIRRWLILPNSRRSEFTVSEIRAEAPGVSTVVLQPRARHAPFVFEPGQFAWIRLERGPLAEEHPFTISSAAQDGTRPQITVRHSGDWTTGPFARIREGALVWLDGPHGGFTPSESVSGIVMIAAGVGITPMLSMLRTFAREGDEREFFLFFAGRPDEPLFRGELLFLSEHLRLNRQSIGRKAISGELLISALGDSVRQYDYFICGGPRLVADSLEALADLGIPESQIHTEQFST